MTWFMETSKDLTGRRGSDKIVSDKAFNIAKNLKYNGYQCGLASMVYNGQWLLVDNLPLKVVLQMKTFETKN